MIASWMVYSGVSTLLFGIAASALEGTLRQKGMSVRWLWPIAGLASLLVVATAVGREGSGDASTAAPVAGGIASPTFAAREVLPRFDWAEPLTSVLQSSDAAIDVDRWLLTLWIFASTLLLVLLARSYVGLSRRRREWTAQTLDGRSVLISPDLGPAVVGFLPGRVVVPEWLLGSTPTERELVLFHEDEHVRARDPALLLGMLLACVALPWNLALWWVGSRLRRAVEIACDLRVLARGADPRSYGRLLMEIADRGAAHRLSVAALSLPGPFLERRIRLMLNGAPRWWKTRAIGALVIATSLSLAAFRLDEPARSVPRSGHAEYRLDTAFAAPGASTEAGVARTPSRNGMAGEASSELTGAAGDVEPVQRAEGPGNPISRTAVHDVDPAAAAALPDGTAAPVKSAPPVIPDTISVRPIQVCVVQDGNLTIIAASYRPTVNDTLIDGQPFTRVHPDAPPSYAARADWFLEDRAIEFNQTTFVRFGPPRTVRPEQLQRVGDFNGTPVFAEAGRQDPYLVIYLPFRPGCAFQPYQSPSVRRY